jgi:peptidoglycan/xylan/chitin deacetylase (PgdA/CDA1 family)
MARSDLGSGLVNNDKRGVINGLGCVGSLLVIFMLLSAFSVKFIGPDSTRYVAAGSGDDTVSMSHEEPTETVVTPTSNITPVKIEAPPTVEPSPTPPPPTLQQIKPPISPTEELIETPIPTVLPTEAPESELERISESSSEEIDDAPAALLPTPNSNISKTVNVPILMYHYVSIPPDGADKYRRDLSVRPDRFRAQMAYLHQNGYTTIDLSELSNAIVNNTQLPEKPIILSFDDGYIDIYENAFPILHEFGLKATFFIATGFIDAANPNYMDWTMIAEMSRSGMQIEPHSKTHLDLRDRERPFLIYEILGSQETIEAHTGQKPRYFAYPSGRYDDAVIDVLQELEFWGAVTTAAGNWHGFEDRFEWSRMRVRHDTTIAEFIDLVN